MGNKGLKSYTRQISQTIGEVAKVTVNVNQADANMHIVLPLFTTLGPNPMDLSLIWNYQDRERIGHFGKGCNINTYKEFSDQETYISVREADGSYTSYWDEKGNYEFKTEENNITIWKHVKEIPGDSDEYSYEFKDQEGNRIWYKQGNTYYPTSIEYANGFKTTFAGIDMDNGHGDKVRFSESNQVMKKVTYTQDGETLYYVDFSYDSNQRLTAVKHYKESRLVKHLSITYGTNEITVKDEISKDYAKYTFTSNCVTKIIEVLNNNVSNSVQTSIDYEDRRTTLTDNDGRKVYIYFDKNNFPLYEIDEEGNVIETEYDGTTKRLIRESSVIPTKQKLTTISTANISMFTKTSGIKTSIANVSDSVLSSILEPVFYVSGTGSLSLNIPTQGLGSDTITAVIWGKQWTAYSQTTNVKVTLTADGKDTDVFKKRNPDGNFDIMTLGVTAIKSYSKITLTITLTGNASIELGGIQVLKKDFGDFYQYDEHGNVTESESGKGSVTHVYNTKGLQTKSVGKDSTMYDYEYDDKGNMTLAKTAFGGKIENTYDAYNNLTKRVVSNASGIKKLETKTTYDSKGRHIISQSDELGNTTNYEYDNFGRIEKIRDALDATTEYSYDVFDNLTKILFNNSISIDYTYDSQGKLETATLPNETVYSFGYDASNNLNSVSMNGELIVSFTYDIKTGLIKNQKYGTEGDSYDFIYNTKHNISQIKINGTSQYYYQYDQNDRLIKVLNYCGTILRTYTYNNDGQVTKTNQDGSEIDYQYDGLGEVNQRKRTLDNKTIYESMDSISRSKGFSPDNLIGYLQGNEDFLGTMFNSNANIKNPNYYCKPYNYKTNTESKPEYARINRIPCIVCGLTNPISYNPPFTPYTENSGCIGFWFYPTSTPSTKRYLFYTKASSSNIKSYVAVYQNSSNELVLELKENSGTMNYVSTTTKVQLNQWNFFGLNFMYRDDGQGYAKIFSYELYLNSEMKKGNLSNKTIMTDGGLYHVGYRFDGAVGYEELDCKITGLMIGCRTMITTKQMQEYYSLSKDYILGNTYLDGDSVDFSTTTVHNLSETMLNQFEIYPLQNSVESLKGKKPIAYDVRRISNTDKDRTFNYNNKIKRYAYVAEEGRLEYALNMTSDGSVIMRAFIREDMEKQYFFELKDIHNNTLGLYRGKDKYLYLKHNSRVAQTTLQFNTSVWHTIGLSFKTGIVSNSMSTQKNVTTRVYLDGKTYTTDIEDISFEELSLSVGRMFDNETIKDTEMGNYTTKYPLLGQIEMLATRAAYCEVETLNTLASELKGTTKVSEYDELGLLQRRMIKKEEEKEIITISYEYKDRVGELTGDSYEAIECFIRDMEQLIRIAPNETVTLEANQVYIGVTQDIQELNPDVLLTKVSWDISEEAYEEFGSEGQTEYDHMDQAVLFIKDKTWTNTSNYTIYLVDTGFRYDAREESTNISTIIQKETIKHGASTISRSYTTNAIGNVTAITDTTFGSHTYTYNARGFLTKEDTTEYAYDNNGNITKAGSTTFTYDTTIKDRLKTVNGKEITYGSNPLNPTSYNGDTYEWEGRRLVKYNGYTYSYNDQGLRTSKSITSVTTKYYYDGDKLITEYTSSSKRRLDFLYDENDILYGFIYNNSNKYFYIRDYMQNILGIVDTSGSLVVKYGYTAYGKITSITGTLASTIGTYNPFRYKGYYYDTESGMYYCKSRYYNPAWCRWLNADHIAYLDFENINGMNLFSYCKNNPVMLVDEEGEFAISIGFAIVCGLVALSAMVSVAVTKPEISSGLVSDIESGLKSFGDFIVKSVTEKFVMASLPYMLTFVALDNVMLNRGKDLNEGYYEYYKPHSKNRNPNNLPKHERGERRKKKDHRGEKGDSRRSKRDKRYKIPKIVKQFFLFQNCFIIYF